MKKYNDEEVWVQVNGAKNGIMISNHGMIETELQISNGHLSRGYLQIEIPMKNGKKMQKMIHRLVAEHFVIKNRNLDFVVKHIDDNRFNNHFSNLEWIKTQKERNNWKFMKEDSNV